MSFNHFTHEFVDLVKVDRHGREQRESMPRWLAEIAIALIPLEEPEIALAKIEPIQVNPKAPYPINMTTPERAWYTALFLASYLPSRIAA